jgi:hypothetical protein
MLIRDRFGLILADHALALLAVFAALAMGESVRRSIDIVVLWLAAALQFGLVLAWVFIPRLPKWIVAGWGLILMATGLGVIITAPVPAGGGPFPWALVGLLIGGVATILAAVFHGSPEAHRL